MKRLLILSTTLLILAACSKENNENETSTIPQRDTIDTTTAIIKFTGNFVSSPGKSAAGKVLILTDSSKLILALENVTIQNGPDLYVYLTKTTNATDFIDLGRLKSTTGNQLYNIPGSPDFLAFKYVLIQCKQFNIPFGYALLK